MQAEAATKTEAASTPPDDPKAADEPQPPPGEPTQLKAEALSTSEGSREQTHSESPRSARKTGTPASSEPPGMAAEVAGTAKAPIESDALPAPEAETRKSPIPWIGVLAALVAVVFLWTKNRPEPEAPSQSTAVSVEGASAPSPAAQPEAPPEAPPAVPPMEPPPSAEPTPEEAPSETTDDAPATQETTDPAPSETVVEASGSETPPKESPTSTGDGPSQAPEVLGAAPADSVPAGTEPIPAAGPTRTVLVQAFPAGAHIGYQGKELGRDSVEVQVAEGERKALEIGLAGYSARRLVIDGSRSEVTVVLKPIPPASEPAGSKPAP